MIKYKIHPVAELFPMMSEAELQILADDIQKNGLQQPIVVLGDFLIDGRNRMKACELAGIIPASKEYDGDKNCILKYILGANLHRRHLDTSQRAALAVDLEPFYAIEAEKNLHLSKGAGIKVGQICPTLKSTEMAGKDVKVSGRIVSDAKKIKQKNPVAFAEIRSGKKTVNQVKSELNIAVRHERNIAENKPTKLLPAIVKQASYIDVLLSIPTIDLLIADPPYFTDGNHVDGISQCLAKVKSTGQAYIFSSADPQEVQAYLSMDSHHMVMTQMLIWNYNNTGQRQPNDKYNSNYQICFYFRGKEALPINKPADGTHQYACQTVNAPDGRQGDRFHTWQKPIDYIERLIRNSSQPGDFVFDPFVGSGTTVLAAAKLGRKNLGCDIEPEAIKICMERGCTKE